MTRTSSTYVALLRGVNVGGKNRLPMKDLAAIVEGLGAERVRTHLQSGNVVLDAEPALGARIGAALEAALAKQLGLTIPVVLRTARELRAVAEDNPFLTAGVDESTLHVGFLAGAPKGAAELDPQRSPGDSFVVRGREIYLALPNGAGRSKLTNAWFDSKLRTISTMRNWRTVLALVELSS